MKSDDNSRADASVTPMPDRDLVELAYICALDAMAASEHYETMTRLDNSDALTRRKFDAITRDVRETMAVAGHSVYVPPPADLRSRILDAVGTTEQVAPDAIGADPDVESNSDIPVESESREFDRTRYEGTVVPLAGRSRRWRLGAAAAIAVVAVGIGGGVVLEQTASPTTEEIAATSIQASVTGGGTMTVTHTPGDPTATVAMAGVSDPPAGSVYQVWLIDGGPVSVGVMTENPQSVPVDGAEALSITVEPTGGSTSPTSAPIARVDLT